MTVHEHLLSVGGEKPVWEQGRIFTLITGEQIQAVYGSDFSRKVWRLIEDVHLSSLYGREMADDE